MSRFTKVGNSWSEDSSNNSHARERGERWGGGDGVLSPYPNLEMQHNKKRIMLILVEKH
jgi:hypothetical protein